ncbi:YadA family autotransporter adhesin [Mannheimia bovis]|uniref:YadA-like family protein n=1 Tax=Mannheimia bovis TaxID=2770636 RepID=A0A7H1C3A4_9PAST|nr:YadA family autotransporter adhesin [Mannheimia bovis]QNS15459.1 YadA-like family protein [Mannheimia bovis]
MKSYTFNCSPHSVASLLLTLLISSSAYANSYSAGNGQALGTNSTAIGQGSYTTSTNGVAIGHNAIATGEGMNREQFAKRREAVADIERQIGEKQKEISNIDAQLYSIQSLIDGIERRITDINQRQIAVARLLEQQATLQKQRETIENNLSDQQNQLTQANDAYNRVSKDSRGDSLYSDFDKVLRTLDWSQLNQANGRETLTTVLKNKIENEFTDLAGQYTEQQYRALIDGYINRNNSAGIAEQYLREQLGETFQYINTHSKKYAAYIKMMDDYEEALRQYREDLKEYYKQKEEYDRNPDYVSEPIFPSEPMEPYDPSIGTQHHAFYITDLSRIDREILTRQFDSNKQYDAVSVIGDFFNSLNPDQYSHSYSSFTHRGGDSLLLDLYFSFSSLKENSLVNVMINDMYPVTRISIHEKFNLPSLFLPPLKENHYSRLKHSELNYLLNLDGGAYVSNVIQILKAFSKNNAFSEDDVISLNRYIKSVNDTYGAIDFERDEWFFDLVGYKENWDKVKAYSEAINQYITGLEELKREQSKPLGEQNNQRIDELNAQLLEDRNTIVEGVGDKRNFSQWIVDKLTINKEVIEREFAEYLPRIQEFYNHVDKRIRTYDSTDPIIVATKTKSEELKRAVTEAQNKVNSTQNEINQLIDQIASLGLSPDDETLADRKREQEQLLNQRQGELVLQRQELVGKQTELEQLNKNLANSSIANIGENSIAEGANAFASGKNAIADGVNALAIGENAIAQGNNAQALGKDSTAQGTNAVAVGENATAEGANVKALGKNSTAQGANAVAKEENATATGANAQALGKNSTAQGANAVAAEENATATGANAQALGKNSTVQGANAVAAEENSTATGANAQALGKNSTAQGANAVAAEENATATGANAQALGKNSTAQGANAVAKEENATATGANAQALGKNSTAQGANAVAKEENATATGASAQALGKNSTAQGANAVAKEENATATGANAQALGKNSTAQGANAVAKEENATATGANAQALGKDSIALGNNAVSAEQRAMALGINTQALGSASTVLGNEAVATKENATVLGQNAAALASGSVALGQGSLATAENEVSVGNEVTGLKRKINNVSNGLISDTSSEAVTGQQLYGVAQILGAVVTSNGLLDAEFEYYEQGDAKKTKNVKTAIKAVSQNNRYASVNSTGNAASAKGNESVAIGGNSAALGANSVAMGSGSVALSDNEFSVGNSQVGLSRRITNVADGVADNDAATVGQLNRGIAGVESKLQKAEKRLSGGVAGAYAAASLVNASLAGDNMLSVGTGTYNGSTALAVGYSKVSDNGKIHLKLLGSANNQGEVGGGASVGFKFK